jgi:hypothetical protein
MFSRALIPASLVLAASALFAVSPAGAAPNCVKITGNLYNCADDGAAQGDSGRSTNVRTAQAAPDRFQFTVMNHNFRSEPVTALVSRGMVGSDKVRICISNQTSSYREINFGQRGVHPFKLEGRNSQTCATFPASTILDDRFMTARAGSGKAKVNMGAVSLRPYAGSLINMVWGEYRP